MSDWDKSCEQPSVQGLVAFLLAWCNKTPQSTDSHSTPLWHPLPYPVPSYNSWWVLDWSQQGQPSQVAARKKVRLHLEMVRYRYENAWGRSWASTRRSWSGSRRRRSWSIRPHGTARGTSSSTLPARRCRRGRRPSLLLALYFFHETPIVT